MRLSNCDAAQDAILTECEAFGGKAAEAAEIADILNAKIEEAEAEIEELKTKVKELENQ